MEFVKSLFESKYMKKNHVPDLLNKQRNKQTKPYKNKRFVKKEFSSQGHADSFTVIHVVSKCPLILFFQFLLIYLV